MFVCCECWVLSGRGLCDELITRPEESYRLWYVVGYDLETSWMKRPWPALVRSATKKNLEWDGLLELCLCLRSLWFNSRIEHAETFMWHEPWTTNRT
jgi:hypothetical protein